MFFAGCYACRNGIRHNGMVCSCVYRAIFRNVLARYKLERQKTAVIGTGICRIHNMYARPSEEFQADVLAITRRTLSARDWKFFKQYFLIGNFVSTTRYYPIMTRLGQAYVNTRPYPLYPLTEYFGTQRASNMVSANKP